MYTIQDIAAIIQADKSDLRHPTIQIDQLLIDSRKLNTPSSTLFFALSTDRRNGEAFIEELYQSGVRNFVVKNTFADQYLNANFLVVDQPLKALQSLAAYHRRQFDIPVIGITGSNGKTIVKEWLYQLLNEDYNIVRSPKSYNSQIGVPLSIWQMNKANTLAIFEAGISQPGEMALLQQIIRPTIGVLTNIGAAHDAGFDHWKHKLQEKWKLFDETDLVIFGKDNALVAIEANLHNNQRYFCWGKENVDLVINAIVKSALHTNIACQYKETAFAFEIPFTDDASVENAITCTAVMLALNIGIEKITQRMKCLQPVEMRLQLKKGNNNCSIINDSYSNDSSSLTIALNFLQQQAGNLSKTVILSDLGDVNATDDHYAEILKALKQHEVDKFIGIGNRLYHLQETFRKEISNSQFFATVAAFKQQFLQTKFANELILLKGARSFHFEEINLLFEQKVHQTVLEVNLSAMVHNLKEYQGYLKPKTKLMAMVKAFSYGSGSAEVASVLQYHKVDYLAVAYADEGVELRKAGIHMPIMVMNPEVVTFDALVEYNLEPELYAFGIFQALNKHLEKEGIQKFPVHLKIDTGMHRLGFEPAQTNELADELRANDRFVIKSVFSHLAGSEDPAHDDFTQQQFHSFQQTCSHIQEAIGYPFLKHILNSAGIFRHPHLQLDMVRLGIGLYGVDSSKENKLSLHPVAALRSTVSQVKTVKKGDSVGYNRKGIVQRDSKIATIRIGYADGFSRRMGNGVGSVFIKNAWAPVVGNVCMDMIMVDVTDIPNVTEGESVEIFGPHISIHQVAKWCDTISYEIMTGISQRVKREYYME